MFLSLSSCTLKNKLHKLNPNVTPCCDVAGVRKCDGALRHDTFSSDVGHVRVSRERNAAVQYRFSHAYSNLHIRLSQDSEDEYIIIFTS